MSSSYPQILRSTAITGGAAGVNVLIGLVAVKCGAVLLGPAAFGLLAVYQAFVTFAGSVTSLGIQDSAVRSIARANSDGDLLHASRIVSAALRVAWTLGPAAWILTASMAWPLSRMIFGSDDHAVAIMIVGIAIPLGTVTASRLAVYRGFRKIGDLARISVITTGAATAVSVCLFAWLRAAGIAPSIVCSALIAFAVPLMFRHRLPPLPRPDLSVADTVRVGRSMAGLGVAMLTASAAASLVGIVIPALVTRELGASAMGMYAAAWGVSGAFAGFIFNAMSADYFPRLSGASHDPALMTRLVNEQTAVGVLLALPGLVATIVFAPFAIRILYSAEFQPAAELLYWYALGIFGRVTSWPMSFVLLVRQQSKTFIAMELVFSALWIGLTQLGLKVSGLVGVSWGFCTLYAIYNLAILAVVGGRSEVRWDARTLRLVVLSLTLCACVTATLLLPVPWRLVIGSACLIASCVASLRGLAVRLGSDHRLVRSIAGLPVVGRLLPN